MIILIKSFDMEPKGELKYVLNKITARRCEYIKVLCNLTKIIVRIKFVG